MGVLLRLEERAQSLKPRPMDGGGSRLGAPGCSDQAMRSELKQGREEAARMAQCRMGGGVGKEI